MSSKIPIVAIVGRTNVGKSTLFNAILGRRVSIVEDSPGVTRDRHYALVKRYGDHFTIIDTGGIAGEQEETLRKAVKLQTDLAIEEADIIVVVLDGIHGVHSGDQEVAEILRGVDKPVLWVVNKCESEKAKAAAVEFYALGIDEFICVSAAHQQGLKEFGEKLKKAVLAIKELDQKEQSEKESAQSVAASAAAEDSVAQEGDAGEEGGEAAPPAKKSVIRIAVIGKPNVGKSSLINRILGEERLIASPIAGTTRDAINITLTRNGREFEIMDTAGLRRKSKIEALTIERFSALRALRALVSCDVAILVIDAMTGLPSDQDLRLAALVHERGRGLVVVINKWDAIEKDHRTAKQFEKMVKETLTFAPYAPVLFVSALTGQRCPAILKKATEVFEGANTRIKTAQINKILLGAFAYRPPPVYRGHPVKLFFATQISEAPPTFVLFVNFPGRISDTYQRYLKTAIRRDIPFPGSDIKLIFRKRTEHADESEEKKGRTREKRGSKKGASHVIEEEIEIE